MDFLKRMRSESEKCKNVTENTTIDKEGETEDITSTQNMVKDARKRRATLRSKRIHCDQCGNKFNKQATFETHMKNVHGKESSQGKGNIQININSNQSNLTFHERTRTLRSYKILDSALDPNN